MKSEKKTFKTCAFCHFEALTSELIFLAYIGEEQFQENCLKLANLRLTEGTFYHRNIQL